MFRVWVVVLAVALTACGQKDTEVAKESVTEQKPAEQGANELHLYNWNNYIAEETVKRFGRIANAGWYRTTTRTTRNCWRSSPQVPPAMTCSCQQVTRSRH
jgi:hypothetical protein